MYWLVYPLPQLLSSFKMENDAVSVLLLLLLLHDQEGRRHDTDTQLFHQGVVVDLYVPRKCTRALHDTCCLPFTFQPYLWHHSLHPLHAGAATSRLITAKDHSSVQINVAEVDENGKMVNGKNVSYAFSGYVRSIGEVDDSFNMLATEDGRESQSSCCIALMNIALTDSMSPCRPFFPTVLKNVWSYNK
jgi:hypothetical protein